MPVMGRGPWLAQALYSILMQSYDDVEVVLKDGDPTHPVTDSPEVHLALRCFRENQIKYAVGKDGGIFPATNDCLKRATGDILYFMCSDDLLCPGALYAVEQAFKTDRFGGPFWVCGKTISADITGKTLGIDGAEISLDILRKNNCIGQPSTFWNRQMMNLTGLFDLRYRHAADYDLWLRFWKRREPFLLDQTLGIFRHHENQNTQLQSVAVEKEARSIASRHAHFADLIVRVRNTQLQRQAYGGAPIPISHDDEG